MLERQPPGRTDRVPRPPLSPGAAMWIAMAGLAAAMGIGRFAFTPLMPLMQAADGLTLAEGGWIASANYAGYLAGALLLFALDPPPRIAAVAGLVGVAATTLAMGLAHALPTWIVLRALAGAMSALVFVGLSGWMLEVLPPAERVARAGGIYAGVGLGMAVSGLLVLAAATMHVGPAETWLWLGLLAASVAAVSARPLGAPAAAGASPAAIAAAPPPALARGEWWRLVLCYGALGIGYILPATFLPALARELVPDAGVFGWAWPVFGLAAALSTVVAATVFARTPPRRLWAVSQLVMAAGVLAPLLKTHLATLAIGAAAVGGTFMVVTMAGIQEARLVAGSAAPRLIAAMTAAFAIGQWLAPLAVRPAASAVEALVLPSIAAAATLVLSTIGLLARPASRKPGQAGRPATNSPRSHR